MADLSHLTRYVVVNRAGTEHYTTESAHILADAREFAQSMTALRPTHGPYRVIALVPQEVPND